MFKNLKLSAKIGLGFGLVLLMTGIVGFVGFKSLSDVATIVSKAEGASDLESQATQARIAVLYYLDKEEQEFADQETEIMESVIADCATLKSTMNDPVDQQDVQSAQDAARTYHEGFQKMVALTNQQHAEQKTMGQAASRFLQECQKIRSQQKQQLKEAVEKYTAVESEKLLNANEAQDMLTAIYNVKSLRISLMAKNEPDVLAQWKRGNEEILTNLDKLRARLQDPVDIAVCNDMEKAYRTYQTEFIAWLDDATEQRTKAMTDAAIASVAGVIKIRDLQRSKFEAARTYRAEQVADSTWKVDAAGDLMTLVGTAGMNRRDFMNSLDRTFLDANHATMDEIYKLCDELESRFDEDVNRKQVQQVRTSGQQYAAALGRWAKLAQDKDTEYQQLVKAAGAFNATVAKLVEGQNEKMHSTTVTANAMMIGGALTAIVLGVGLAVFITRSITKPINRIISGLASGSEQTASASQQVASSSQSLAEGASEQAAAIEETTASVEEMSSMTRQNASNATEANSLAEAANKEAQNGASAMKRMSKAIDDIKTSSDETAKIVKTIDEIAFQTNLLALNAAVEAARAGEAGKGFAVVAEEVRNLAQRSAEAAKNTAEMIETAVTNAEGGVEISREVGQSLEKIAEGSEKVNGLVAEIAAACNEQSQGIEQINQAVTQMDSATQQAAANAEESASASEELSAQAEQLNGMVDELRSLVEGAKARRIAQLPEPDAAPAGPRKKAAKAKHQAQQQEQWKLQDEKAEDLSTF
ncbi:MAG: HAMP domain-containing methyl-accepting chemotaxis protein [Planctomycetota bacterium]